MYWTLRWMGAVFPISITSEIVKRGGDTVPLFAYLTLLILAVVMLDLAIVQDGKVHRKSNCQ